MIQTPPRLSLMRTMAESLFYPYNIITMRELKKHTSIEQQIELLRTRGLVIQDEAAAAVVLSNVNYYRLTGYLHHYRQDGTDCYQSGLSFAWLKRIYDFDRKLTRILLFSLEDIEETMKTRFSYTLTSRFKDNPSIYLEPTIFKDEVKHRRFLDLFQKEVQKNRELPFVKHHIENYAGVLPMWVAVELFTMGNLRALYDNVQTAYQKEIAKKYHTGPVQLSSWLKNLTDTRNHLAHNMRIYNFNFGRTPKSCNNHRCPCKTNMIFDQIFVIACMYSEKQEWSCYVVPEIKRIIEEYREDISLDCLGFPPNWETLLLHANS